MTGCRHKGMKIASTKLEQASTLAIFVGGTLAHLTDFATALGPSVRGLTPAAK